MTGNPAQHPVDGDRRGARLKEVDGLADNDREGLLIDVQARAHLVDIGYRPGLTDGPGAAAE